VAAAAAQRGAQVTALGFLPGDGGDGALATGIEFREGDRRGAVVADGSLTGVMNFGMLHLAQPERAVSEALRVLRPAEATVHVWAKRRRPWASVSSRRGPNTAIPMLRCRGAAIFRFSTAASATMFEGRGLQERGHAQVPQVWPSAIRMLFDAFLAGTVRTQALLRAQSAPALAAIRDAVGRSPANTRTRDRGNPMPRFSRRRLKP